MKQKSPVTTGAFFSCLGVQDHYSRKESLDICISGNEQGRDWYFKTERDSFKRSKRQILLAQFDGAVVGAVHLDLIRERFLAQSQRLASGSHCFCKSVLKGRSGHRPNDRSRLVLVLQYYNMPLL